MNIKIITIAGIVILGVGLLIGFSFQKSEKEITVGAEKLVEILPKGRVTPNTWNTVYMLQSTSTATARSNSIFIAGAKSVTLFVGVEFASGDLDTIVANEFTIEVGNKREPGQGVALYSTTTTFSTDFLTSATTLSFSTSTPFGSINGGTTTASVDLDKNTYPFLRIVRTATADTSTSTVVAVIEF